MIKKYIIAVHTSPNQLKRLINRLNDDKSEFYIHVDLKSDIKLFEDIIYLSNVEFIKERINCVWGDFSQVIATINLLKCAVVNKNNNSKIIFLSGQDYPIKSLYDIDKYLDENKKDEFISFDNVEFEHSSVYNQRIHQYKINKSDKRLDFVFLNPILSSDLRNLKLLMKLILKRKIKIIEAIGFIRIKRKSIFKKHYKGSNWFALNYEIVNVVLDFIEKNKVKLFQYYKYTACADEQFFHTILNEVVDIENKIHFSESLHFVDWDRKNVPLPVTFNKDDIELIVTQPREKLFARKFDEDSLVLNLIDEYLYKI